MDKSFGHEKRDLAANRSEFDWPTLSVSFNRDLFEPNRIELKFYSCAEQDPVVQHSADLIKVLQAFGLEFRGPKSAHRLTNKILECLVNKRKIGTDELLDFSDCLKFAVQSEDQPEFTKSGQILTDGVFIKCKASIETVAEAITPQLKIKIEIGHLSVSSIEGFADSADAWKISEQDLELELEESDIEEQQGIQLHLEYAQSSSSSALLVSVLMHKQEQPDSSGFTYWDWSDYFLSQLKIDPVPLNGRSWEMIEGENPSSYYLSKSNCIIAVSACLETKESVVATDLEHERLFDETDMRAKNFSMADPPEYALERLSEYLNLPTFAALIAYIKELSSQNKYPDLKLISLIKSVGVGRAEVNQDLNLTDTMSDNRFETNLFIYSADLGQIRLSLNLDAVLSVFIKPNLVNASNDEAKRGHRFSEVNWIQVCSFASEFPVLSSEEQQLF